MEQENNIVDMEKVEQIKKRMAKDTHILDIANTFKVFGDYTRLKIICALLEGELCVGEISETTNTSASAASHQLKTLKQAKLVKYRKVGKVVYYSLDDEHVKAIFEKGYEHVKEA